MKLLLDSHIKTMRANGRRQTGNGGCHAVDFKPVVKLFTADAQCTWLLTEIDPENPDIAFGLCDLGMGFPELGSVSLSEIAALRGKLGLPVERDRYFKAKYPLSVYTSVAHGAGRIIAEAFAVPAAPPEKPSC